jgi:alpha-tubulin suppressor-like RCC1 family protein
MLTVLLVAVTSTSAVRVTLVSQYYNQLSQSAGEAGMAYAQSCLDANDGVPQWSDSNPLKPNTDCTGAQLAGYNCPSIPTDARCSVMANSNLRTTFSVGFPNVAVNGWKQISTGRYHTCAIDSNSKAYCWGYNTHGELGINSSDTNAHPVPIAVGGTTCAGDLCGKTVKSISVGQYYTCAIDSDGKVYCWGHNDYGQIGDNTSGTDRLAPVAVNTANGVSALYGKTVKSIVAGFYHTCAIASDSNAYCWGDNANGGIGDNTSGTNRLAPVAVNTANGVSALYGKTVKSVAIGDNQTCAIASDSNAYCWGYNNYGELGDNTSGTNRLAPVAVNTANGVSALYGKTVKSISVAYEHTCVIASDNQAYCWGRNNYDQIGDNTSGTNRLAPVAVNTANGVSALYGKTVTSIAAGIWHTCAIASDSQVYCWGRNNNGQIGDNTSGTDRLAPVAVNTANGVSALYGKTVKSIAAGGYHTCAIASDGQVYCWGLDDYGQIGDNTSGTDRPAPVAVTSNGIGKAIDVNVTGTTNLLRSSDKSVWRQYNKTTRLTRVEWLWRQVAAGGDSLFACGISFDSQAYCWGHNNYGQLGNNSITNSSVPVAVNATGALNGKTIKSVSAAAGADDLGASDYAHTCAIASDNNAYCWGWNSSGQLGNNTTVDSYVPTPVDNTTDSPINGKTIIEISNGNYHTCAVASDSWAYCWGWNNYAMLGDGNTDISIIPVAVSVGAMSGKTVLSISSGGYHSCVIASDNLAYCWGANDSGGQLGDNTAVSQSTVPVKVYNTTGSLNGKTILSITTGFYHSCVIASDNLAYCWGDNGSGQLGNNSTTASNVAVPVNTAVALSGKTLLSIAAGYGHTCAIASDSKVYCWGLNDHGQLGDGSTTNSLVPVVVNTTGVLSGKSIVSIMIGYQHTCVIASDSRTYCWGLNNYGQLGNGTTNESHVPVAAFPPRYTNYSF